METIYSGIFQYNIPGRSGKSSASRCFINIVKYDNGACCVMMIDDKRVKGVSVTMACSYIATQVYKKFLSTALPDKIIWLEHSPSNRMHNAHVDLIQFQHIDYKTDIAPTGVEFLNPQWKRFIGSKKIVPDKFLETYEYVLKKLSKSTMMIFTAEDKNSYHWRVWANDEGFFIVSENPSAVIPSRLLHAQNVVMALQENRRLFDSEKDIGEQFTAALMKGFLDKGL